jgi:hypothetical protein
MRNSVFQSQITRSRFRSNWVAALNEVQNEARYGLGDHKPMRYAFWCGLAALLSMMLIAVGPHTANSAKSQASSSAATHGVSNSSGLSSCNESYLRKQLSATSPLVQTALNTSGFNRVQSVNLGGSYFEIYVCASGDEPSERLEVRWILKGSSWQLNEISQLPNR